MDEIKLGELVGGAVQEKFQQSFAKVMENLLDVNTSFKAKRAINIKLTFDVNETRDDAKVHIDVTEKLAPQAGIETGLAIGRNLRTGKVECEEYGKYIKGQMQLNANAVTVDGQTVDTETGEVLEKDNVVDLRKKA